MYELDVRATQTINGVAGHSPVADLVMSTVSAIGVPMLVVAVALQWWRNADRSHVRHVLISSGFSFLLGLGLNQLILLFVHRMRPYDAGITHLLVTKSADPSFPSDHATASVAIATAFLLHGMRREGLWFFAASGLVMVSRVYIGIHYVNDVIGGALTGALAAIVVLAVFREGTRLNRAMTSIL